MITQNQNTFTCDIDDLVSGSSKLSFLADKDTSIYGEDFVSETHARNFRNQQAKKSKEIIPINEATRKEILKEADAARKARAKKLTSVYKGCSNYRGWITFQTNSQYTPGRKYTQYVKLKEAKDMKYFKEFNKRDIVRLFLTGDLQVHCTCPDFKYRYRHMAHAMGYGIFKETRFPHKANPNMTGSVCKHLISVLNIISMRHAQIERDLVRTKFFKRKYEDAEYLEELEAKKAAKKASKPPKKK